MKKLIYGGLILVLLGMNTTSCKKKEFQKTRVSNNSDLNVKYENNMLIFESEEQLNKTLFRLSEMEDNERVEWEKTLGFESLLSIDKKLNEEEGERIESFFQDVDPDLSVQEYEAMGLIYEPSISYKEYLKKGVIERIEEEDGSFSTELAIKNKAYLYVLSENGKLQVGDLLYDFDKTSLKIIDIKTGDIVHQEDFTQRANGQYNFTKGINGTSGWVTDPSKGSNYRYRSFVSFSSSYTTSTLSQNYYWYARAERKRFGNWSVRNNYLPIWGFNASWKFDYSVIYNGDPYGTVITSDSPQNFLNNTNNRPTTPYSLSSLNTNYTVRYMYPHGLYSKPSSANFDFFENVRMYSNSYSSSFSGGSNGYNYSMY